jgi:hypothetical protein
MHPNESPYAYCGANPVNRVDPTGLDYGDDEDDQEDDGNPHNPADESYNNEGVFVLNSSPLPDGECGIVYHDIRWNNSSEANWLMYANSNGSSGGNNVVGDRTNSNSVGGASSSGSIINNVTNVVGAIDFSHSLLADNSLGTKINLLNTALTGYQVYDQYKKGGISNINPVDATSASISTISLIAKGVSSFGFGGSAFALISEGATFGGYAVAVYQSWYMIYKPMNDLNFAPSGISDGVPIYGDPTKDPY